MQALQWGEEQSDAFQIFKELCLKQCLTDSLALVTTPHVYGCADASPVVYLGETLLANQEESILLYVLVNGSL